MINTKRKIITTIFTILLGLILAGSLDSNFLGDAEALDEPAGIKSISGLKGSVLGGIKTKMPENSTKILFEGILGLKLNAYRAYNTIDEVMCALYTGEIQAAWFADVTAGYMLKTRDGLKELHADDIVEEDRLEFAMALRQEDKELRDNINIALSAIKESGKLDELTARYIEWVIEEPEAFYERDMTVHSKGYSYSETIYVGVTGMTPPLEQLDISNNPYGFCVALMDEIAQMNGINVNFIYLNNESAFSSLMGGRVDIIFCYGTSRSTLDPDDLSKNKNFIMTDGYYGMNKYSFLSLDYNIYGDK